MSFKFILFHPHDTKANSLKVKTYEANNLILTQINNQLILNKSLRPFANCLFLPVPKYFLAQYATGAALTAGDMSVGVLSGGEVKALQGH